MPLNDFFEIHPELKADCIEACNEMKVDFNKIRPYVTKDSIGVEIDEDGLCHVSTMKDQSVFYH